MDCVGLLMSLPYRNVIFIPFFSETWEFDLKNNAVELAPDGAVYCATELQEEDFAHCEASPKQ